MNGKVSIQAKKQKTPTMVVLGVGLALTGMQMAIIYIVKGVIGERNIPIDESEVEKTTRISCAATRSIAITLSSVCILSIFMFLSKVDLLSYNFESPIGQDKNVTMRVSLKKRRRNRP